MLIKEKSLQHWVDNFYGYGSWQSPIWYIGYEEGGGDLPEEVAEKFNYFFDTHPASPSSALCDLRDMYRHVGFTDGPKGQSHTTLHDYRFGDEAVLHGVWKNLIAFQHSYLGKKLPDLLEYQRTTFGIQEALIRLYPLPSPHNHAWYYSWLDLPNVDFLQTRKAYEERTYPARIATILGNIAKHKPEIVVMYGMNNINTLKRSVQEFFPITNFKMVKAIKQQIPQHHRADINGTVLIITTQIPALRHGRVESGFDWGKFGEMVRADSEGLTQRLLTP